MWFSKLVTAIIVVVVLHLMWERLNTALERIEECSARIDKIQLQSSHKPPIAAMPIHIADSEQGASLSKGSSLLAGRECVGDVVGMLEGSPVCSR